MDFANDYDIKAMAILIMSCHDMIDNLYMLYGVSWSFFMLMIVHLSWRIWVVCQVDFFLQKNA